MSEITYCPICNTSFIKKSKKKYCCHECALEGSYRNKRARAGKKKTTNITLSEKIREAKERGISYGQLIAEEYMKSM